MNSTEVLKLVQHALNMLRLDVSLDKTVKDHPRIVLNTTDGRNGQKQKWFINTEGIHEELAVDTQVGTTPKK